MSNFIINMVIAVLVRWGFHCFYPDAPEWAGFIVFGIVFYQMQNIDRFSELKERK